MTNIWHDYSQQPELEAVSPIIGVVSAVAEAMALPCLLAGAFARDLHLHYRWGIPIVRGTDDFDFAMHVRGWDDFDTLKTTLIEQHGFKPTKARQRLQHVSGHLIDIVPFGKVESADRTLAWPPDGNPVMDVFGFNEALQSSHTILLPGECRATLVSLPALAMLKLVCWKDRHRRAPGKDAADLALILDSYLQAGNAERLYDEFAHWLEEDDFDYEPSGPRMAGHDMRQLIDEAGATRLEGILNEQCSVVTPGALPAEMNRRDPERARRWLGALVRGLVEPA